MVAGGQSCLERNGIERIPMQRAAVMKGLAALVSAIVLIYLALLESAVAQEACEPAVGRIISVQGTVEVRREGTAAWRRAGLEQLLCRGDSIRVGSLSRAAVALANQSVLRIDQNTTLNLISVLPEEEQSLLRLVVGAAQFFSRKPRALTVDTPYVNAAVEGTEFFIRVGPDGTLVAVFEGIVAASNARGSLDLTAGQSAMARPGEAPEPFVMVRPRDAVQWALYYPPILAIQADPSDPARGVPQAVDRAFAEGVRGNTAEAFALLEAIPESERGASYYLYRAALLLNVGRVDDAQTDIDEALARDPSSGLVYALRAVIAVAQNDNERALADAERAVELAPGSVPPKIALSYAQQANFQLEAARDTLLEAVDEQPQDGLAWARLAELWLALGYRSRALEAAGRAAELSPDLGLPHTVQGFAALAAFRPVTAKDAFEQAIRLNSADPIAHFGLGLAEIRQSNLKKGRREIEIAVGLDPNNALLRAYLGKAYFAERATSPGAYLDVLEALFTGEEIDLAGEQFAIAKELDPKDPTAWFYDAILKQSQNRPVEALHDVQEAIRLNDNRAIFRSRELLDEDRAARGASLARIYDDLGFEQLGVNEAAKSLAYDPASTSAHRFLSDIYSTQPRREIARVSELLQAQLLQDVNINPVQPSLNATNLNIFTGGGPVTPGLGEFSPLFERNQAQLNITGEIGNNETKAGEAIVSGVYDRFSVSAGQFHYKTDGFRENFDLEHNITDFFAQAAITPEFNVQGEVRLQRSETGDRRINYDPEVFSDDFNTDLDDDMARVGLRFSPSPQSDIVGSVIYSNIREKVQQTPGNNLGDFRIEDKAIQGEGAFFYKKDMWNLVAGFGYYQIDRKVKEKIFIPFPISGFPPIVDRVDTTYDTIQQQSGYLYSNVEFPENVTWTIGFSYDGFDEDNFNRKIASPKVGVQWDIFEQLRLRFAAFRTMKPVLSANRTIQPTQVAGFNQFFDDANGTEAWHLGVGLDARLTQDISAGLEASARDISQPSPGARGQLDDKDEMLYSGYLYWTPHPEWALRGEVALDLFENNDDNSVPKRVRTLTVPLSATYFSPLGFFAGSAVTYVNHKVNIRRGSSSPDGHDSFVLADAAVGFRFPERRGLVSVQILHVFDKSFSYQDDSFRTFGNSAPTASPFLPERTFLASVTLNF
jgi:tetratricopeptide (TPR) repeat protein